MATVSFVREANVSTWDGFHEGVWQTEINVRDFIQLGDIEPPSREVTEKVCTQFPQAGLKAY